MNYRSNNSRNINIKHLDGDDMGQTQVGSLEHQAIRAIEYLATQVDVVVSPAHLHHEFHAAHLNAQNLFSELQKVGEASGLATRLMQIARKDFTALAPAESLLLHPQHGLLFIKRIEKKSGLTECYLFEKESAAVLSEGDLFNGSSTLQLLCFDGKLKTFLTTDGQPHAQGGKSPKDAHSIGFEHKDHLSVILSKLVSLLKEEKGDMGVVFTYAVIVGLLSLIVPLSAQAIVNAVMLGVFTTQLFVLCTIVAVGLLIVGAFDVMKRYVIDVLQRRIFVRTAFEIGYRLPKMKQASLESEYTPELVNRFFDVLTIQKTIGKFLLDGVSATLITIIGLLLLALYHPFFILFDLSLLAFIPILVFVLGRDGLVTSIKESKKKYAIAAWLEEVARCQTSFKLNAAPEFVYHHLDHLATEYVTARNKHFIVLARQIAGSVTFRAFATVGVLGIGGSLVVQQQLSIGQLVAAELVIVAMLGAIEKLIDQFEQHYDLLTAIDKLSYLIDKPLETSGGSAQLAASGPASLALHQITFNYTDSAPVLKGVTMRVPAGSHVSLVGESGAGKTTLSALLVGLYEPTSGIIEIDGIDTTRMGLDALRQNVGIVLEKNEIFEGTIEENILLGRHFTEERLEWALKISQLYDVVRAMPDRLNTQLHAAGLNMPIGLIRRVMFARAIISKPRILILDEAFAGLEERTKLQITQALYAERSWTIINISHDAELIRRSEKVFVLKDGKICEDCPPRELAFRSETHFAKLFPDLVRQIIEEKEAIDLAGKSIELKFPSSDGESSRKS